MDEIDPRVRDWIETCHAVPLVGWRLLPRGAGARRYARVSFADGSNAVWMHARSEDPAILPPALRTNPTRLDFVDVTRLLARHGVPVPELYAVHEAERWILLEDLGDRHLCDLPAADRLARQEETIDLLLKVHAIPRGSELPFERAFDEDWIHFELGHFLEHGVDRPERQELSAPCRQLEEFVARLPRVLCLRDVQSQNLMIDGHGALRILDYQDALMAPPELDLAALVYDSYLELTPSERTALLERYARGRGRALDPAALAAVVVQRKCKDFARFRYLSRVKEDFRFQPFAAVARRAVLEVLGDLPPPLAGLARVLPEALAEACA